MNTFDAFVEEYFQGEPEHGIRQLDRDALRSLLSNFIARNQWLETSEEFHLVENSFEKLTQRHETGRRST